MGAGPSWTREDMDLLRENMSLPDKVIAEKLGRTGPAVTNMKRRLREGTTRGGTRRPPELTYDTRPSGWYEEAVGQMLIDYKPAYETWLHYHRYVEVERVDFRDSFLGGIVWLRCRRDADAP